MTIALDTTALVARYVRGPGHAQVISAMRDDSDWCACALALTEAVVLIDRLAEASQARLLRATLLDDWAHFAIVPVDQACLEQAAALGCAHPLRTIDALHLAAANRLPRPVRYATLDPHQIPVAKALGFEVISPT